MTCEQKHEIIWGREEKKIDKLFKFYDRYYALTYDNFLKMFLINLRV